MNKNTLQISDELPKEWAITTLGEALPISYGKSLTESKRDTKGQYPVYGSSGKVGQHSQALTSKATLLIGRKGSIGAVYYSPEPCWPIDTTYFAEEREDIDLRFFEYLLKGLNLRTLDKSTAVPGLSRDDYNAVQVAIAPLQEQKLIVAEIEKQFSRLDEAVANLKRVKANLKRYKAATLKAAVEGKLTAVNVHESGKNWKQQPIDVAIESLDQGWSPRCENEPSDSPDVWGVIKTTAVQALRFLEIENKRLPAKLKPRPHLELSAGDLLITRAGPRVRVGVACLVKATRSRLLNCDKVYRLRAKNDVAIPAYLELVLNAPHIVDTLDELKTGISDSGVNLTQKRFRELIIPIPPLIEQQRIVLEVGQRLSILDALEVMIITNSLRVERLRQAILRDAFQGHI